MGNVYLEYFGHKNGHAQYARAMSELFPAELHGSDCRQRPSSQCSANLEVLKDCIAQVHGHKVHLIEESRFMYIHNRIRSGQRLP